MNRSIMRPMNFVSKICAGKVLKETNLRNGQPSTKVSVSGKVSAGSMMRFIGWVVDGESVAGNTKWFKTDSGEYLWSGNVEIVAELPISNLAEYKVITSAQISTIVPRIKSRIDEFVPALNAAMQEFLINTPVRQAAFLAQTAHESIGYSCLVENLNYSAEALQKTWPARFPKELATLVARQPEKIANIAYANRLGNGNELSGDGWRYRGRGIMQITGRDNYKACGTALGLDLLVSPQLLEQPLHAFRSAGWFWKSRNLNEFADKDDLRELTRRINGGFNGLDDRIRYHVLAKSTLGIK